MSSGDVREARSNGSNVSCFIYLGDTNEPKSIKANGKTDLPYLEWIRVNTSY